VRFIDVPEKAKIEFYQPVKCGVAQYGILKE